MTGTNHQFVLQLPDGWSDQTSHMFAGPEDRGLQHALVLIVDPSPQEEELAAYATGRIAAAKQNLPAIETLKEEERALPSGIRVYEWVYRSITGEDEARFTKYVYALLGQHGFTFVAIFTKYSMQTVGVEVDRIIESFRPQSA